MAGSDTKFLKDLFLDEIKECDLRIREYSEELRRFRDRKRVLEEGMRKTVGE